MQPVDMSNFKGLIAELYKYPPTLRIMYSLIPHEEKGVYLDGEVLHFYGQTLDLSAKPQLVKVFASFLSTEHFICDREKLFQDIFSADINKMSLRQAESLNQNLLKALSRARKETTVFKTLEGSRMEWFVFDKNDGNWRLFRMEWIPQSAPGGGGTGQPPPFDPEDWEDWDENF